MQAPNLSPSPTVDKSTLQRFIADFIRQGYQLTTQTETSAQLVKKKKFSFWIGLVTFILAVLPFVIYLLIYLSRPDDVVHLQLLTDLTGQPYLTITTGVGKPRIVRQDPYKAAQLNDLQRKAEKNQKKA